MAREKFSELVHCNLFGFTSKPTQEIQFFQFVPQNELLALFGGLNIQACSMSEQYFGGDVRE
jgi:hypothetical protein